MSVRARVEALANTLVLLKIRVSPSESPKLRKTINDLCIEREQSHILL